MVTDLNLVAAVHLLLVAPVTSQKGTCSLLNQPQKRISSHVQARGCGNGARMKRWLGSLRHRFQWWAVKNRTEAAAGGEVDAGV